MFRAILGIWLACWSPFSGAVAQVFHLPTPNRALLDPGGEERYFVGTVGKPWTSGTFGCVRSSGFQMHEGLDIRATQRDRKGEATDPVFATANGSVAYISQKSALSNYGKYIVLKHLIDGVEVYSLYAHLREIRSDLAPGRSVAAGETIGTLGRSANTREGISKERAHLHFELNLLLNDRFPAWFEKSSPGQRNDHGMWNGQNLVGFDPQDILLRQFRGGSFNLVHYLHSRPSLIRVMVRKVNFPFLTRYRSLARENPALKTAPAAGYEIALNYHGVPLAFIPRTASEMQGAGTFSVVTVNEAEYSKHPCRRLVSKRGGKWHLTDQGTRLLELLTY